ncbi:MAG TPA: trehalose-phosphatase, partial [Candidatus Saccharimonadia bacterium]
PAINGTWRDTLLPLLLSITERTPGSLTEIKDFALVWHYRNVTPDLAYVRREQLKHELEQALDPATLRYYEGKKIIEIKPEQVNKGVAGKRLLAQADYDFVLAIGDDYTDEHLFAALPNSAYTIHVGRDATSARYYLSNVEAVIQLLAELATFANSDKM